MRENIINRLYYFVDDYDSSYLNKNVGKFLEICLDCGYEPIIISNKNTGINSNFNVVVLPSFKIGPTIFYLPTPRLLHLLADTNNIFWGYAERGHQLLMFVLKFIFRGKIIIKTDSCLSRKDKNNLFAKLVRYVLLWLPLHIADLVITESEDAKSQLKENNYKVIVAANGYDKRCDNFINKEKEKSVIYAGRISWAKGTDLAVNIFSSIINYYPEWKFRIIGRVEKTQYLQKINLSTSNTIEFSGELPKNNLLAELAKAYIYLLPSREEGLSNTIPDAMRLGCKVVATNAGETSLYKTTHNDVYIAQKNDEKELRKYLEIAMSNFDPKGSEENRLFAKNNLDWDIILEPLKYFLITNRK